MMIEIRRIHTQVEDINHEFGQVAATPLRRGAVHQLGMLPQGRNRGSHSGRPDRGGRAAAQETRGLAEQYRR